MDKQPNILFILSDQHRYDCTGYVGKCPVNTPNMDRLAAEGMQFNNAFTPIPLCCPARQALLNGRRPEAFGALWNYDITLKIPALEPVEYAWPRDFKASGYSTGYLGKWHVHPVNDPTDYGFDDYIEKEYYTYRRQKYPEIELTYDWFGEKDMIPLEDSHTHWLANQATSLIDKYEAENKPWLIRLDFDEPHLPCHPSEPFHDMYSPDEIPVWGSFYDEFRNKPYIQKQQLYSWDIDKCTWDDWAPAVARYYGIISQMDDAIGKVLNRLDELGIAGDTIVIYSSDHGDMCGAHRMIDKHYVLYDDVVKIPFLIRWPEVIEKGSECNEFVYNCLDLPPTLLESIGIAPKDFFHGRSLLPLLKGKKVNDWRQEVVSTYNGQQFGLYTQRMIRNSKWKYIWNTTDVDELYNLESDPYELDNLIHDDGVASIITELRKKLYDQLVKDGDGLASSLWMKYQLLENRKL